MRGASPFTEADQRDGFVWWADRSVTHVSGSVHPDHHDDQANNDHAVHEGTKGGCKNNTTAGDGDARDEQRVDCFKIVCTGRHAMAV